MTEPIVTFLEGKLNAYMDDLRTLVSIDSGSYDKEGVDAVNDWLENRLTKLGFAVERHPQAEFGDDLLGTLRGKGRYGFCCWDILTQYFRPERRRNAR